MLLTDKQLDEELKELAKILNPDTTDKINSHMVSIMRQIEDLRKSRDGWKKKFENCRRKNDNHK